jgi:hypothetical protein
VKEIDILFQYALSVYCSLSIRSQTVEELDIGSFPSNIFNNQLLQSINLFLTQWHSDNMLCSLSGCKLETENPNWSLRLHNVLINFEEVFIQLEMLIDIDFPVESEMAKEKLEEMNLNIKASF